ncbi:MAG: glucose 1-dehydrogenase [Proteobacteria bacterium]|nr:glucose 1-dehydrogenase [Pseudomonadota bacterium]
MILDRFRLDGKVAVVTGAGRGIGRGCALAFAEAGADVVVAARTQAHLDELAEAIRGLGRRALTVPCDVTQPSQLDNLASQTLKEFGRVDVLLNNAGGSPPTPMLQLTDEAFEEAFHFNVTSAMSLSRHLIPHMVKSGVGSIINISSGLSHLVEPGFAAYGTAKAALSHLTRLMACEFAPHVRVNAIAVGATLTDALSPFVKGDLREQMEELTPLGRLGEVEDISACALYLAAPAASWVTGKIFEVDGGTVASNWPLKIPAFSEPPA